MKYKTIGILGGTGFVGQRLSSHLAKQGYCVSILTHNPVKHRNLSLASEITIETGDPFEPGTLKQFFTNKDVVINLVGILNERKDNGKDFHHVHVDLAHHVAMACETAGVQRLLHMSALHADANAGSSYYLRSKGEAEDWAQHASEWGLKVTSFRPSVIFGEHDSFLNRFASMLAIMPAIFPLACAQSRFAPVYVNDVAAAFLAALENDNTIGKSYELCGPRIYTLGELVSYTARCMGLKRLVIGLPDFISRMQAWLLGKLPGKLFTMDNYRSLQTDSVCDSNGLTELGITPTALESVAPKYLGDKTAKGRLNNYRRKLPYNCSHNS